MKKIISIIVAVMLIAGSLSACSDKQNSNNNPRKSLKNNKNNPSNSIQNSGSNQRNSIQNSGSNQRNSSQNNDNNDNNQSSENENSDLALITKQIQNLKPIKPGEVEILKPQTKEERNAEKQSHGDLPADGRGRRSGAVVLRNDRKNDGDEPFRRFPHGLARQVDGRNEPDGGAAQPVQNDGRKNQNPARRRQIRKSGRKTRFHAGRMGLDGR